MVQKEKNKVNKSQAIRDFLTENPKASNKEVLAALAEKNIIVTVNYISTLKNREKNKKIEKKSAKSKGAAASKAPKTTKRKKVRGRKSSTKGTCYVMVSNDEPYSNYYDLIFYPAIKKARLTPVRVDYDPLASGEVMKQAIEDIKKAQVLVAELTSRDSNVFYKLGLAHALGRPVILVASNDDNIALDLPQGKLITYDVNDPFWGKTISTRVAEAIQSEIS